MLVAHAEEAIEDDQSSTRSTKRSASKDSSGNLVKKAKDSERVATKSGKRNTRTSRGVTSTRLQSAQSGAAALGRELFRVEDNLCLQIACSDEGVYEGSCANARLHLNLDDNIPKRIVERIGRRLNLLPEESGRLEHHHRIVRCVSCGRATSRRVSTTHSHSTQHSVVGSLVSVVEVLL